jgi:glyoxylase-like metal-dependent hydrolase (beta-lactamase superfamily II)
MKNILTFLFILISLSVVAQDWDTVQIEAIKVSNNVYMLKGAGGNIGVITGDDGVLIVDNQFAPLADKIKAAISEISSEAVKYVVNTHWHGDHMGGNEVFGADGSVIIAHDNVRTRVSTDQFMAFQKRDVPARPPVAWPIVTFSQDVTLYFNDEEILIHYATPAHTDGDAVVYFKNANVIHMGDAFVRYGYPFVDNSAGGSVTGMIGNLDTVIEMTNDQTQVIPGHGEIATRTDMIKFRDALKDIVKSIQNEIDQGHTLEDIQNSGITKEYDPEYEGGFIKGKDFVMFVYEDLVK